MNGMEEVIQAQMVGEGYHVVGQISEAEGSSVPLRPAPASRIVALGWMVSGGRNVYGKKPVVSPADLNAQKIRMIGNPIFLQPTNDMGCSYCASALQELHSAIEHGARDVTKNKRPHQA